MRDFRDIDLPAELNKHAQSLKDGEVLYLTRELGGEFVLLKRDYFNTILRRAGMEPKP